MLKEARIRNFRALENVHFKNMGRIALVGGPNGSGKTSALEAIWAFSNPTNPLNIVKLNIFRRRKITPTIEAYRESFHNLDTTKVISYESTSGDNAVHSVMARVTHLPTGTPAYTNGSLSTELMSTPELSFEYHPPDDHTIITTCRPIISSPAKQDPLVMKNTPSFHFTTEPLSDATTPISMFKSPRHSEPSNTLAEQYGQLQLEGEESRVTRIANIFDPDIKTLVPIAVEGETILHAEFHSKQRPMRIDLLGEGTYRVMEIAISFNEAKNGYVMIDEIENGLHYTALAEYFTNLYELAELYNVQIFATTHSRECIVAAYDALGPVGDRFSYHRTGRASNTKNGINYTEEMLTTSFKTGLPVR